MYYLGAGTSGRLGVLDASEMPPTYSVPSDWFNGIIAGGDKALRNSIEGAEDKPEMALKDFKRKILPIGDVLIGISTSGRLDMCSQQLTMLNQLVLKQYI
ncbi:MAG: hypothetical protein CM1200mP1_14780 [Candidatus Neomarinimicrobiota bacterium]|nr:MAG: hypothetical protein CM1200mP1_14780 [Candidatus Neomarinimicrobiota bacterium]